MPKQNLLKALESTLSVEPYVSSDGRSTLLKARIVADARRFDPALIKLLMSVPTLKEAFFVVVEDAWVFRVDIFVDAVSANEFLPSSFTKYSNLIGLSVGGRALRHVDDVVIEFPYKDCVLAGGQKKEDEERQEIFYNEVIARDEITCLFRPKAFVNAVRYDQNGESQAGCIQEKDNLLVRGNNLIALYSLLHRYENKVKLIYIDPPFNTGSDDFRYNDKFNHSSWLTFMKNRLEVAKRFLAAGGVIVVHLDDNEVAYCKVLMDEVFGRDCYSNQIAIATTGSFGYKSTSTGLFKRAQHLLLYGKGKKPTLNNVSVEKEYDKAYKYVFDDISKPEKKWKWRGIAEAVAEELGYKDPGKARNDLSVDAFERAVADFALRNAGRVFRTAAVTGGALAKRRDTLKKSAQHRNKIIRHPDDDMDYMFIGGERVLFYKERLVEIDGVTVPGEVLTDMWDDIPIEGIAREGGVSFPRGKKPEVLLRRIIELTTEDEDLVMDFFAGSGTTLAVAHKLKRQYIGVEQLDYVETLTTQRLRNVVDGDSTGVSRAVNWKGKGSFVYATLAPASETIRGRITSAKSKKQLGSLLQVLQELPWRAYINVRTTPEFIFDLNLKDEEGRSFVQLPLNEQKALLQAVLDKNQLYLDLDDIDDSTWKVSKNDRTFSNSFYGNS